MAASQDTKNEIIVKNRNIDIEKKHYSPPPFNLFSGIFCNAIPPKEIDKLLNGYWDIADIVREVLLPVESGTVSDDSPSNESTISDYEIGLSLYSQCSECIHLVMYSVKTTNYMNQSPISLVGSQHWTLCNLIRVPFLCRFQ